MLVFLNVRVIESNPTTAAESLVLDPEVTGHGMEPGEACIELSGGHTWGRRYTMLGSVMFLQVHI